MFKGLQFKLHFVILVIVFTMTTVYAGNIEYGVEINDSNKVYTQKFNDVPKTHWAFKFISEMANRGVVTGYPDGLFRPENTVSRAEFAKIMVFAAGLVPTKVNKSTFDDVKTDDWYCPFIETAKEYLSGYFNSNGKPIFKPSMGALREDIAVALVKLKGYDTSLADVGILNAMFKDVDGISEKLKKYVAVAIERGLMSGYTDNTFRAQEPITRAEAAALLWRAFQYGNDNKENISKTDETAPTTIVPVLENTTSSPKSVNDINADIYDGKKAYIDTLSKANLYNNLSFSMTTDGENIYYLDIDNKIYIVNIESKNKTALLDTETWFKSQRNYSDLNNVYNDGYSFSQIYYDNINKKLLILFKLKSEANLCLFEFVDNTLNLLYKDIGIDSLLCTLPDGRIVAKGVLFNLTTGEKQKSFKSPSYSVCIDAIYYDNAIYYSEGSNSTTYTSIYQYNFSNSKRLFSINGVFGFVGKYVYSIYNDKLIKYTTTGKELTGFEFKDVKNVDLVPFKSSNMTGRIMFTKQGGLIVYDKNASSFRIINEKKD